MLFNVKWVEREQDCIELQVICHDIHTVYL